MIACWIVAIAIIVAIWVVSFDNNYDLSKYSAYLGIFIGAAVIVYYILTMIMRCYFTRMKNSSTAQQYYRAVKRLITTHKLRQWLPLVAAVICPLKLGSESFEHAALLNSSIVIGAILASWTGHWFLDDEFRCDIVELRDIVERENAA